MKAIVMAQVIKILQEPYEPILIDFEDDGSVTLYGEEHTSLSEEQRTFLKEAGCILDDSKPRFVHIPVEVLES